LTHDKTQRLVYNKGMGNTNETPPNRGYEMTKLIVGQTVTLQTTDEYDGRTATVEKFFQTSESISVMVDGDEQPISVEEFEIVGTDANKIAHLDKTDMLELQSIRRNLSYDLKFAIEELHSARDRRVEAAMQGDSWRPDEDSLNAKIKTAETNLDIFDQAHPEVIAQINKEKAEAIERNMWN
jgi:hypothetical protein